jgi:tetratricopeptide (TPR) repeat protein
VNPERLAELEEQRRFLLNSIRDIEREHEFGDVGDDDYQALHDGYVARAAAVMREIEDGRSSLLPKKPARWGRRIAIVGGTVAVAVALGLFVANSAGQRLPGQSLTGGQPADEVAIQLAEGRRLLGTDSAGARAAFERVLAIEPNNAEAATYSSYLLVIDGQKAGDQAGVRTGIAGLEAAAQLDDTYGDPHCLLAVSAGTFLDPIDEEMVTTQGALCLALDPPQDMVSMIEGLIARVTGETTTTMAGDNVDTLLATADAQLTASEYSAALITYQRVLELEPTNKTALAYSAYLIALNGFNTANLTQVDQGIELLRSTIDSNPDYADAHCLLAFSLGYFFAEPDAEAARAAGEECLALNPPEDMIPLVQQLLDELS